MLKLIIRREFMTKKIVLVASAVLSALLLCNFNSVKNKNSASSKEIKPSAEQKPGNVMPYPTPYNSALQDFKFDFTIDKKTSASFLVIYSGDKVEIKRIALGVLEKGNYSRVFDRAEFAGIQSGIYFYRFESVPNELNDNQEYKILYILR
jgi:hypothetical protein